MRLIFYFLLLLGGVQNALAQGAQDIQKRSRGISELPVVPEGLNVTRYASGFGEISAIAGASDGSLYVSDHKRGRVYYLSDRNKDGVPDLTRMIADGFSTPSGLVVIGENLYISDAYAIWVMPRGGGEKHAFVSLSNAKGLASPRPLMAMILVNPQSQGEMPSLVMGLTKTDGTGQLISIDLATRRAERLAESPSRIHSLARSGASLWVGTDTGIMPMNGKELAEASFYNIDAPVNGLVLPGQFTETGSAFAKWKDHILVGLGHSTRQGTIFKGSQVAAIETQFGNTVGRPESFITGFVSKGGRTGWGQPGPMWVDGRGVFLTDSWSGTIWRISGENDEPPQPEPKVMGELPVETTIDTAETKSTALPLVDGIEQTPASMIKSGSLIEKASTLEVGSTIIRKYEDDLKAKETEKTLKDELETSSED